MGFSVPIGSHRSPYTDVIVLTAMGEERAMDVKEAPKGN